MFLQNDVVVISWNCATSVSHLFLSLLFFLWHFNINRWKRGVKLVWTQVLYYLIWEIFSRGNKRTSVLLGTSLYFFVLFGTSSYFSVFFSICKYHYLFLSSLKFFLSLLLDMKAPMCPITIDLRRGYAVTAIALWSVIAKNDGVITRSCVVNRS